jgi:antitoxin component of MazEF toxin-antitoxin module
MSTASLRKWGNSAGIIIPAEELKKARAFIGEEFEVLPQQDGSIVLKPVQDSQKGWTEAFNAAAEADADKLLLDEQFDSDFDKDEWTW